EAAWMTPRPGIAAPPPTTPAPTRNRRTGFIDHRARARQLAHPLDDLRVRRCQPRPKHLAASPIDRRRDNRTRVHIQTNARTLAKHRGLLHNLSERPSTEPRSVTHEIA